MHEGIVSCAPDATLGEVARLMTERRVHCIVVFVPEGEGASGEHVWGIVSDLDLVAAVDGDVEARTAGETAASPVVTAAPDLPLDRAAQLMREYSTSHLVVADPVSGAPKGIISTLDVAAAVAGGRGPQPRP